MNPLRKPLSRRTLLRASGVALGLPALEAMLPRTGSAQTVVPPQRFLAMHALCFGYVGTLDPVLRVPVPRWANPAEGRALPLVSNSHLKPFFDRAIQNKLSVLVGLTDRILIGTHDSPVKLVANTFPIAKYQGGCVILTAQPGPGTTVETAVPDPFNGATTDQIAAAHLGATTKLRSLTLAVDSIGGNPNAFAMSNRDKDSPVPAEKDPFAIFNRLFGGSDPQATVADVQRRLRYRKSIVDGVRHEAARLQSQLGKSDQRKLGQYLESVYALEKRIVRDGSSFPAGTVPPARRETYTDKEALFRAMQDLIELAFVTDSTRVVAFAGTYPNGILRFRGPGQAAFDGSRFREFTGAVFSGDHHSMSHYDQGLDSGPPSAAVTEYKKDWMDLFAHWTIDMYAQLLAKLDSHTDVDGQSTILDNTVGLWGGDNSDSASHSYASMPCLLGGRGGRDSSGAWRIRGGQQLRFTQGPGQERSWKDLLFGILQIVGVPHPGGTTPLRSFGYASRSLAQELA